MLSDEEREAINHLTEKMKYHKDNPLGTYVWLTLDEHYVRTILNLIEKQSKEIEELKREKETNQQMMYLAETQILGYAQGYKDGLNKETTATQIVAKERENQIIYEGIKHKINMEWKDKIKAKIEESELLIDNSQGCMSNEDLYKEYGKIEFGQSLLEKE